VLDSALTIGLVLGVGLLSSFVIDDFVTPQAEKCWRRPTGALLIHCGLWLIVFAIEFMQFQRLWVSAFLTATIQCVLVIINHAKYAALREPFIYQDVQYLVDACRFPRLYVPFFGWGRTLVCIGLLIFGLLVVLRLEAPVTEQSGVWTAVVLCIAFAMLGAVFVFIGSRSVFTLSFRPEEDIHRYGLLPALWLYFRAERQAVPKPKGISSLVGEAEELHLDSPQLNSPHLNSPHVIVVQSESFFDIRRWCPAVDASVLTHFDRTCAESIACGVMAVPAWGANTVRTEFSFLTGIALERLGIDRFNPYRRLVSAQTPSLARQYQQRGYRTVAIHPYSGKFYHRDRLFPLLGFDRLIDISEFEPPEAGYPYVGDLAVAQKIEHLLQEHEREGDTRPLFIFVITMENHGPLHLENFSAEQAQRWLVSELPAGCSDIPVYLRHLANADAMVGRLTAALAQNKARPGVLCWYGDHVPIMDGAYAKLGAPAGCTDYFIWRSDRLATAACPPAEASIDMLGQSLLRATNAL
jgi:phosphoglycerol transferase MdoB-like AlkP superfamily enzyme